MTERLTEWGCPKPWTTTIVENDMRAGDRMAMVKRMSDRRSSSEETETSPLDGIYLEAKPGRRLVFTNVVLQARRRDWLPQPPFMIGCLEIRPEDAGTFYRASARHWDETAMRQHEAMGSADGWNTVAGQLKALAEA